MCVEAGWERTLGRRVCRRILPRRVPVLDDMCSILCGRWERQLTRNLGAVRCFWVARGNISSERPWLRVAAQGRVMVNIEVAGCNLELIMNGWM